jgi:hypothetical protein
MNLSINAVSLAHGVLRLKNVVDLTHSIVDTASNNTLCGSYSGMSELSELGATHGCVLYGSVGSAITVAQSLAEQVDWGRHTLDLNRQSFLGQDCVFGKALASCDVQHLVEQIRATYAPHPTPCFADFSFPTPMPTIPISLDDVIARLASTNHAQAHQALTSWTAMSSISHQASAELNSIANDLFKENSGDVICAAHKTLTAMAATTEAFSLTSAGMAGTVGYFAAIALAFLPGLMTARTLLLAIPEPAERESIEAAILVKFRALFGQALMGAVPAIRNLTQVLSVVGDGLVQLAGGSNAQPPIEKLGHEMSESAVELAQPQSHKKHECHADSKSMAELNTDAASGGSGGVYAGSYVNASMGSSFQGAVEASAGGAGAVGGSSAPLGAPHAGVLGGSALTAAHVATQPAGVDTQAVAAGSQVGSRGAAAGFPGFLGGIHGRPVRHAASTHSASTSNAVTRMAAAAPAMSLPQRQVPQPLMIPEVSADHTPRKGKLHGVLQHMPQTPNARDLLGDNPPTVPGVIGTWVRIDPQERTPNDFKTGLIG